MLLRSCCVFKSAGVRLRLSAYAATVDSRQLRAITSPICTYEEEENLLSPSRKRSPGGVGRLRLGMMAQGMFPHDTPLPATHEHNQIIAGILVD